MIGIHLRQAGCLFSAWIFCTFTYRNNKKSKETVESRYI